MKIADHFVETELLREQGYLYIGRDGRCVPETEPILREHRLSIRVNGEIAAELVCLPQYLPELTAGHLLTSGAVSAAAEIEEIDIDGSGENARVSVSAGEKTSLAAVRSIPWKAEWIFALADRFAEGMPLHEKTWATHSAFLGRNGECLFSCEDIGRHNALDKAVGYAVRHGVDLRECYLYSSGRMPADMVEKAIRAGVPLLASKAAPTADGAALAKRYALTLVCAARRDRMKVFAGDAR